MNSIITAGQNPSPLTTSMGLRWAWSSKVLTRCSWRVAELTLGASTQLLRIWSGAQKCTHKGCTHAHRRPMRRLKKRPPTAQCPVVTSFETPNGTHLVEAVAAEDANLLAKVQQPTGVAGETHMIPQPKAEPLCEKTREGEVGQGLAHSRVLGAWHEHKHGGLRQLGKILGDHVREQVEADFELGRVLNPTARKVAHEHEH